MSWKIAPAPPITEIPATQELQKELEILSSSGINQSSKKFFPPFKKDENMCQSQTAVESKYTYIPVKRKTFELGISNSLKSQSEFNFRNANSDNSTSFLNDCKGHSRQQQKHIVHLYDNLNCPNISHNSEEKDKSPNSFRKSLFKKPLAGTDCSSSFEKSVLCSEINGFRNFAVKENVYGVMDSTNRRNQSESCVKKARVLPMVPQSLNLKDATGKNSGTLRPVTEISVQFRSVFKEFPYFNYIQSKALDDLLYTDRNFVICSPTGSGKTVIFELAIIRLLMEVPKPWSNIKIVYMAPIKALCSQRHDDWKAKFGPIGLNCKELTGDTEMDEYFEILDAHIIMTTPEKWDIMTRKWRDNSLVQLVRLFLIDEIHVVKDECRGATLEVVVSRMKTCQSATLRVSRQSDIDATLRFVAVSATIPNIEDIAEWLSDRKGPAVFMKMDESYRPVKLRKVVLGFPFSNAQSEFRFDLSLNYKTASIIQTYSEQKPTLVFCATRKGVQQAASILAKDAKFVMSIEHKQRLQKYSNSIKESKLRDLLLYGVGYHHAGVDLSDRKCTEAAFTAGDLPVLFTTSTLAMGVNLPAHLVVIKSTMHYAAGMFQEYSETDILQMIGRAGRPQFDTTATAVIMTRNQTKDLYTQMISGAQTIESSLHKHLVEHLNAEIVLHTITDVSVALEWIRSTFLYIRALKNPNHYDFATGINRAGIEAKLQELCLKNLHALSSIGLIKMDEEINFKPTEIGKLMARYCIAFDTMKLFQMFTGNETLAEMVTLISKCKEFTDVQLRVNEKKTLNTLNKDKNRTTIRFPMEGKIRTNEMKVNCLIQAQLGCISIQDFALTQDTGKIFRNGLRVTKCLSEVLEQQEKCFSILLNALILNKCFRAKLWENSTYASRQLEKIGATMSSAMVHAGLTTFQKIEDTNARELELIVNRHPPFGNQIKEAIIHLPKYELNVEQIARYHASVSEILVTVNLTNYEQLQKRRTAPDNHFTSLIIGDADNKVVFKQKITDSLLLKSGKYTKKIEVRRAHKGEELSIKLISSDYVGLDIQQTYIAFYSGPKRFGTHHIYEKHDIERTQSAKQKHTATPTTRPSVNETKGLSRESTCPEPVKRLCNHFCKNKDTCGHECCKFGVTVAPSSATRTTKMISYLSDLKSRNETFSAPLVKRLKMQTFNEAQDINLQQFAYTQKTPLSTLPRTKPSPPAKACKRNQFDIKAHQQEEYNQALSQHNSSVIPWCQDTHDSFNCNSTDANESGYWSTEGTNVNFELGDDVWDDFDDEKLLRASSFVGEEETSFKSETGSLNEKYQVLTEFNILPKGSLDIFQTQMINNKSKGDIHLPRMEQQCLNSRLPLNSSVKETPTFLETIDHTRRVNSSEEVSTSTSSHLKSLNVTKGNGPLNCFYQYNTNTETGSRCHSEEECNAFIGIFDGIF
ncbi:probable ATP-dependent DNA helicase HFM1 [Callorhinchus milii]|uniref:probable ATP-dependent DNA helicase HFM1 n=1 Tax=Callorhinchus milii TaxID=7868 RepID=UPI00045751E3|nr:probable ATP-dependent DNA helicase HFM1 [Callorhinchus milii]|eukprot:gi/632940848/ref/XP_007885537.1/ PREDICTED: probable ATP-dependent DNA helicase HFM1 [Callorhinchus milii]